jgi:uncharacterized damage-inducible protein DinB
MAPTVERHLLPLPRGFRSREAASFSAQLDTLTRYLLRDLDGIVTAELGWQPKRGANTIGMLLAHLAIVEVYWLQVAADQVDAAAAVRALGIGMDDDGMPLPPDGRPPRALRGWTLADYRALLQRSRRRVRRVARGLTDSDLDLRRRQHRRNGRIRETSVRWILFHVVEHFAGHYGQVLALRHQYRDRRRPR